MPYMAFHAIELDIAVNAQQLSLILCSAKHWSIAMTHGTRLTAVLAQRTFTGTRSLGLSTDHHRHRHRLRLGPNSPHDNSYLSSGQ